MIILDTNVISETQKFNPDPRVMAWLEGLDPTTTYLTAITVAELVYSVDRLPAGKRRTTLSQAISAIVETDFYGRILPFDATAAYYFGPAAAAAEKNGLAVKFADGAIAAIARANNLCPVATRDEARFAAMGVDIINPWKGPSPA
jgi:predicted nucleic acid-binding protein